MDNMTTYNKKGDVYMYGDLKDQFQEFWDNQSKRSVDPGYAQINPGSIGPQTISVNRDYIGEERRKEALRLAIAWGGAGDALIQLAKEIETYISNG